MKLNDAKLKATLKTGKPGKMSDGAGLYVKKTNSGTMLWQAKFKHGGKESTCSYGEYPEVTLAEARAKHQNARKLIRDGQNPNEVKKAAKKPIEKKLFKQVAEEWKKNVLAKNLDPGTVEKNWQRLERYIFPTVGAKDVSAVELLDMLKLLQGPDLKNKLPTAERIAIVINQVLNLAVDANFIVRNPCSGILKHLGKPNKRHMAAFTKPGQLGDYLRRATGYEGKNDVVKAALRLLPLVMLRPGELRLGDWAEIQWDAKTWRIPSVRMKRLRYEKQNGEDHMVPLSDQALAVLKELFDITGPVGPMFKGMRNDKRPISDNTLNMALRGMGYDTQKDITAHGFRATARTLAVEVLKEREAVVEAQLAHSVRDQLGRAYNRAEFLEARRKFMQEWADYLDKLRDPPSDGEVVAAPTKAVNDPVMGGATAMVG